MISDSIKKVKILSSPQSWEVIQHQNGYADFEISGIFEDNSDDDTWQDMPFSADRLYVRVTCENDGSLAVPLVKLNTDGDRWSAHISKLVCGGPYMLDVVLYDSVLCTEQPTRGNTIRHFCVGDVFLIAGQSNAAGMGRGEVSDEPEIGVHVLRNLSFWDIATAPFDDFDYSKHNMFLSFAKKLKKSLGYPIGLIPAAMGGAPICRWIESENGDLYLKAKRAIEENNIRFRAVLWYQGCAEAGDGVGTEEYLSRFESLTGQFRCDFQSPDLPFFTFQLNRQIRKIPNERLDRSYDEIREAQRLAAHKIKNVYVLPTVDCTHMSDFIHLSSLSAFMLGERLASKVLDVMYGKGLSLSAPEILSARVENDKKVVVEFSGVTEFLYDYNAPLCEYPLEIEDENGRAELKKICLCGNVAELYTKRELKPPVYVSGQTGTDPKRIMTDFGTQLPMLCFYRFKAE